jgi:hypothetical protein
MPKTIVAIVAVGLVIGTVGGLLASDDAVQIGLAIVVCGAGALYLFGILKNPLGVVKAEMDVESEFSGYPPNPSVKPVKEGAIKPSQAQRPPAQTPTD